MKLKYKRKKGKLITFENKMYGKVLEKIIIYKYLSAIMINTEKADLDILKRKNKTMSRKRKISREIKVTI